MKACAPLALPSELRHGVGCMGLTTIRVRLSNPRDRRRAVEEELLVDSGAIYAVVPAPVLRRIGVRPRGRERFTLADGTHITREVGTVFLEIDGREGASRVVFGRRGDAPLIGAVALGELGLMLHPQAHSAAAPPPARLPHGPFSRREKRRSRGRATIVEARRG